MTDFLKISNLSVEFETRGRKITALDNVSLDMPSTKFSLGIVGESGSGKTTLGMSLMNLIQSPGRIAQGNIEYLGKDVFRMTDKELRKYRWEEISMVYQSAMNSLNPVKSVSDPIVEVIREHRSASKEEAYKEATRLLTEVGISQDRIRDYPFEFSGGMRQRVVLALSLALAPKILIADEPTSALDVVVQKQILALLKKEIAQRGLSVLFITHEISILCGLVDQVAVMYAGEIVEIGHIDDVLFEPLHPYTVMLLETVLTSKSDREAISAGVTTRELQQVFPTVGCKYANRCKFAFDKCSKVRPILTKVQNGRSVSCHKYV